MPKFMLLALAALLHSTLAFAATTNTFPGDGNVGVGVLAPVAPLHVSKGQGHLVRFQSPQNALLIYSDDSTATLTNSSNTVTLNATRLGTGASPRLRLAGQGGIELASDANTVHAVVTNAGNFGIGTTTPGFKLTVAGAANATSFNGLNGTAFRSNPGTATNATYTGFAHHDTLIGSFIQSNGYSHGYVSTGYAQDPNRKFSLGTASDSNFNSSTQFIPQLTVVNNGNVGIGTDSPTAKLTVIGTISAKEVKVTTTGFPDYVFADDYKLRTLDEVEAHIKQHKHLPGIPSAAEVERDGLALSDISKKQMEKIEELTLYLIDMKKQNENLTKRLEALEAAKGANK